MEIETEAKLLTAESKPYNIDGNEGVSHRIRLNVDGEIYSCKSSADQVAYMKQFEKKEGTASFKVNSRKENLSLELVSFEASE
jgi:hypothetical protein